LPSSAGSVFQTRSRSDGSPSPTSAGITANGR
jgi:hypothetical protein